MYSFECYMDSVLCIYSFKVKLVLEQPIVLGEINLVFHLCYTDPKSVNISF